MNVNGNIVLSRLNGTGSNIKKWSCNPLKPIKSYTFQIPIT